MRRRKFSAEAKSQIVLLGLRTPGRIAEICREHNVHPSTWSHWKKAFLEGGVGALERGGRNAGDGFARENQKLRELVGTLYVELDFLKKRLEVGK